MYILYNDVLCRQFGITFQIVDSLGAFAGHVRHVQTIDAGDTLFVSGHQVAPLVEYIRINFEYTLHLACFYVLHVDVFDETASAVIGLGKEEAEHGVWCCTIVHIYVAYAARHFAADAQ